jgi:hypothetical protein
MQYRPQNNDLIDAIQEFLLKEVLPFMKDNDALVYKTLVSWNMLGVVSRALHGGPASPAGDARDNRSGLCAAWNRSASS